MSSKDLPNNDGKTIEGSPMVQSPAAIDSSEEHGLTPITTLQAGNVVHIHKRFTTLSAMGMGHAITNSAIGVCLVVQATVSFGGAPLFFWGWLLMAFVGLCAAVSLGELCSMYPHPGGQYYWTFQLAPENMKRFLSYFAAILSWAGAVCTTASTSLSMVLITLSMIQVRHPDVQADPWAVYIGFVSFTLLIFGINCFERILPYIGKFFLFFTMTTLFTVFVSVLARSPAKMDGHTFFFAVQNESGWPDGLAFLIGLNGLNWCFSCLDAAVHLSEEIPRPERNIPKVLLLTVAVGFVTGLLIIFALFFSSPNVQDNTSVLSMLMAALPDYSSLALALQALIVISNAGGVVGGHTWQSRLAWAFSRNGGFFFSRYQAQLAPPPFETPIWAHAWSCAWVIALGSIYIGSAVTFNSLVSASLLYQYLSFCIPIATLLWRGRQKVDHGPFWFPKLGLIANIIVLLWFSTALVIYSWPYFARIEIESFNYTSCVFVGIIPFTLVNWFAYGREKYNVPLEY